MIVLPAPHLPALAHHHTQIGFTHECLPTIQAAIFSQGAGLAGAVGGNPGAASFLMAGLPGKRAMELTDRLTDHGVDPSRLLFNDFF